MEGNIFVQVSFDESMHFAERMREIASQYAKDIEVCHAEMDKLMCETLRNVGYGEGVDIFENTDKWWA